MSAKTSIGEVSISMWGRDYVFRPLFCRIEKLGTPEEILKIFNDSQNVNDDGFIAAWRVMSEFSDVEDIDNLIGYFYYCTKRNGLVYVRGKMPPEHVHIIGSNLIVSALIGKPSEYERATAKSGAAANGFDPAEFVAIGDAHFGGIDWWNKTMIELQKAIRAKNGPSKEEQAWMSSSEIDDLYKTLGKKEVLSK